MKFSHETLMAYADGELDAQTRAAIEAEMAIDPEVAQEVALHRALRAEVEQAFAGILQEPMPIGLVRATKAGTQQRGNWSWPQWTSIAASLLIGVLAGRSLLREPTADSRSMLAAANDGRIVAAGALAQALSEQLAVQNSSRIDIGISFRSKSGAYCRTFVTRADNAVAGFACRDADAWRVETLWRSDGAQSSGDYRMASTQLPAPIVAAIADTMQGEALDADEEIVARQRGWRTRSD